ncbi:hypothetical protein ACFSGX_14020 [Sphingomonas arantia]|uniref:Uncharacterized protein n=1 Tax=Sphingomonas arantia TaxID=1460676 RepID=A0ABW4U2B3_9SPHN
MKHSVFHKRSMLDWIRVCADEGTTMPSDEAIVERFGFANVELARTLLADLADAGSIRIHGVGADRTITFGRAKPTPLSKVVAAPPVRRAVEPAPPSRVDMMREAAVRLANRQAAALTAASQPVPRPAPPTLPAAPPPRPVAKPAPPPSPRKVDTPMPEAPILVRPATPGEKRQVTFSVTGPLLDRLIKHANARDMGLGPATLELVKQLDAPVQPAAIAPEPVPDSKPFLSAAVLRAWRASGAEFGTFLTAAIERGVQADQQDGSGR